MQLTIEECPTDPAQSESCSTTKEYMSSIVLWGGHGRIKLNAYFDLDTAAAWASRGLQVQEADLEDSLAIDFFREFSNLQAGYLRGVLESGGVPMRLSLPFVAAGGSSELFQESLPDVAAESISWRISDGERAIICTAEVEVSDRDAFVQAQPILEEALRTEMKNLLSGDGGDVEFLVT